MLRVILIFITSLLAWAAFTFSFNIQELLAGALVAFFVAFFVRDFLWRNVPLRILSPCRIAVAFKYFFTWLLVEVKAHLEVAFCVLSGRIKPAIVRVPTKLKTDLGKTMVSNSITLTPGTLTMKAGKNLYVHCLRFEEKPAKSFVHFAEVLE